jgi:hypothetical protein
MNLYGRLSERHTNTDHCVSNANGKLFKGYRIALTIMRAVCKFRGVAAVRRCYAAGGSNMPSCSGGGNVVVA